jgi:acyl phosphate:glycerol-3-phosphate acyltransferase
MITSALALTGAIVSAYLIGSFPTSFILAKMMKGIDIRQVGSQNAGATNVLRTVGKLPALITLIVDVLKGVIAVTLLAKFFYAFGVDLVYQFYQGLLGLTVVCGHVWSVFLKFKGGKGVATTLGVGIGITPLALLPTVLLWVAVFVLSHYVSLASIISMISFPLFACSLGYHFYTVLFSVLICSLSIFKHKENIKRLLKGQESKTILFKKTR